MNIERVRMTVTMLLVAPALGAALAQTVSSPAGPRLRTLVNTPNTQVTFVGGVLNDEMGDPVANPGSTPAYEGFNDAANYKFLAQTEFNLLSNENSMKWKYVQYNSGTFLFGIPDADTLFAQQASENFHGAMLVGGHRTYIPDWVIGLPFAGVQNAMNTEIDSLAGRYRTSAQNSPVQVWQVVNEAMDTDNKWPPHSDWRDGLRSSEGLTKLETNCSGTQSMVTNSGYDIFVQAIGTGYVEAAFREAHIASPSALLIYNDSGDGAEVPQSGSDTRMEYIYQMAQDFTNPARAGGAVPINGIGFQAHLGSAKIGQPVLPFNYALERTNFERFSALGVGVYITEMDVAEVGSTNTVTNNDILDNQARVYHNYLDSAIRVAGLRSIQFWGVNDLHTYHYVANPSSCSSGNPLPEPLLFDVYSQPKPAYYAVQDALSTQYRMETVTNNGFESGSKTPWTPLSGSGGTITVVSSGAHSGTYAIEITGRTAANSGPSQDVTTNVAAQGAGRYFLRGWIKVPTGTTTAKLTLRIQDSTGATTYYSTPQSNVTTAWTLISGWVPVKWNENLMGVVLYAETTGTGSPNFFLDDVTLSDGTLLANGRFENGTNGWGVNFGGTLASTSDSTDASTGHTTYYYGSQGVQVTNRTASFHGVSQDITAALLASGPGTYSASAMMKLFPGAASTTGEIRMRLRYDNTDHYFVVNGALGSDKWYRLTGTVNLTWTTLQSASLYLDTTTGTDSYYADDTLLRLPFTP